MPPTRHSEAKPRRYPQISPPPVPQAPSRRRTAATCLPPVGRAEQDLRQYLCNTELPTIARFDKASPYRLPAKGLRTHKNKLRVQHNPDRCLEKIRRRDTKALDDATQVYHKNYVYGCEGRPFAGKHYMHREGEALVLPARYCMPEGTFENTPYPNNIDETCRWLLDRPFKTMQRSIHLAFPDTTRWWFDEVDAAIRPPAVDTDRSLWRTYLWQFHPDEHHQTWWRDVTDSENNVVTEPAPRESMVFVVQPHWVLGPQDFKNVSKCTSLPSFSDDGTPPETPLKSYQRVWAKLYDTCKFHNCHTFALTTYHGWMFGTFSDDWTSAQTSEVKEFDDKSPTVMQSLVYWVASSMGLAGTTAFKQTIIDDEPA